MPLCSRCWVTNRACCGAQCFHLHPSSSDELTVSQEPTAGNVTEMWTWGPEVAQSTGKFPWAKHDRAPATPTSQPRSEQRLQLQEHPGNGGLQLQRPAQKLPLPQGFIVASGQKPQLALIRAGEVSKPAFSLCPTYSFARGTTAAS